MKNNKLVLLALAIGLIMPIGTLAAARNRAPEFVSAKILQQYPTAEGNLCREAPVYLIARGSNNCRTSFSFVGSATPSSKILTGTERASALQLFGENPVGVCEVREVTIVPSRVYYPTTGIGTLTYTVKSGGQTAKASKNTLACKG